MAKKSAVETRGSKTIKERKKRPGVHAKNHNSKIKTSKTYKKVYKGQGKV